MFRQGALESKLDADSMPDIAGDGWVSLFNGKNITGWRRIQGTADFRVLNGVIVGSTNNTRANSYLCTTKEFEDFELTFEVNITGGNSGVQIRSLSKPDYKDGKVHGPQIEIEPSPGESGYIYGKEQGRQWISKNSLFGMPLKMANGIATSFEPKGIGSKHGSMANLSKI